MLDLKEADLKKSRFYQEIWQEGQQEGRQEGRQEGLQEGRQEGRQEEAVAMVLRLLTRRIGSLTEPQRSRVRLLSRVQLEDLGEALLDFQSSRDLEKWFEAVN